MKVETLQIGVGSIIYSNNNALNTLNDMEQLRFIAMNLSNSVSDNEKKSYSYNREKLEKILSFDITQLYKYSAIHDNLYKDFVHNTIFKIRDYLLSTLKDINDSMSGIYGAAGIVYNFNNILNTITVEKNEVYGVICHLEKITENNCNITDVIKVFIDAFSLLYKYIYLSGSHIYSNIPGVQFKKFIVKLREYILKLIDNTTIEIMIEN